MLVHEFLILPAQYFHDSRLAMHEKTEQITIANTEKTFNLKKCYLILNQKDNE